MLTTAPPPPVALIAVLNCPVVDTLVALTCTVPVVELAQMPCASGPSVVIAPAAVTTMGPPGAPLTDRETTMGSVPGAPVILVPLAIVPLSARMPNAPEPFVMIGPIELTLTLPLPERAATPWALPPP